MPCADSIDRTSMQKYVQYEIDRAIDSASHASQSDQSRLAAMEGAVWHSSSAWNRWHAKRVINRFIAKHKSEWDEIEHKMSDIHYSNPLAEAATRHAIMAIFAQESIKEQDFLMFSLSYQLVFGPCEGTGNAR